ncbi:MAG: UDP-3-O-acyl-N-acetylglucosamine deacetylase [Planctomycetota bacterium]
MIPRRTLAAPATVTGRGLFTGAAAAASLLPARPGEGVALAHADGGPRIPATIAYLDPRPLHPIFAQAGARSTNLAAGDARIATVEHLLSALHALGITDALVEFDGPELPILDGSAADFSDAIDAAGVRELGEALEPITPGDTIALERDGARIEATPRAEPGWSVAYELDYGPAAPISPQRADWDGTPGAYARTIAPARTFCLDAEARAMRDAGLFEHLTPRDMLVIGAGGPIDNAYRLPNECAAHKLLDVVGDLALAGRPIQADIRASRSGHALNHELAAALAAL